MTKAVSTISPTRMELIRLRRRLELAKKGHELLEEKMEALMMEFLGSVARMRELRKQIFPMLQQAHQKLAKCMSVMGSAETLQAALQGRREVGVDIHTRSVMGVRVPILELSAAEAKHPLHFTSSLLDEAASSFREVLCKLCELAEAEEEIRRMGSELEKTRRRVNALEYILIPRLKNTISFITLRLDEMERENFVRLKRIKALLETRWRR